MLYRRALALPLFQALNPLPGVLASILLVLGLLALGSDLHSQEGPSEPSAEDQDDQRRTDANDEDRATDTSSAINGVVAKLHIEGVIDQRQFRYVRRAMAEAQAQGAQTIVTHISSPGGELFAAIEMLEFLIEEARTNDLHMIAWIDQSAYSAAAMLAYGHHQIWMRDNAIIGNIGIIFQGPDGEIKYAPEKIETALRAILRATADAREWDKALLVKMTARNQELYEARFPDGRRVMVIEDDQGVFLADNPEIDPKNPQQWALIAGEDRLLTFTGQEAVDRRMATGLMDNIEDLYAHLRIDEEAVIDLSPTPVELTARKLGAFAPLFISLAVLFIFLEFKTPGVGLFAILAALCGGIFFFMQYYQDLVGNWEIIIITLGVCLIMVEIFTMVGGGLLAIGGGILMMLGIFGAFMPTDFNWDFSQTASREAIQSALWNLAITAVLIISGGMVIIALAPRLPFIDRIAVAATIGGTSENSTGGGSSAIVKDQRGIVGSECRPSGTVIIDGRSFSATAAHSAFIASGTPIVVVGSEFGELVVRPADEDRQQLENGGASV